jgi:hypothetical protein
MAQPRDDNDCRCTFVYQPTDSSSPPIYHCATQQKHELAVVSQGKQTYLVLLKNIGVMSALLEKLFPTLEAKEDKEILTTMTKLTEKMDKATVESTEQVIDLWKEVESLLDSIKRKREVVSKLWEEAAKLEKVTKDGFNGLSFGPQCPVCKGHDTKTYFSKSREKNTFCLDCYKEFN